MLVSKQIWLLNQFEPSSPLRSNVQLCFEILTLAQAIDQDCANRLSAYGLSESKFVLLGILNAAPEQQCFPNLLADTLGITRATVTGLLDGLEKSSYIQRLSGSHDKRKVAIQLTAKGQDIFNQVSAIHTEWISELFADLDPAEQKVLKKLLLKAWKKTDQYQTQLEQEHAISH
ncbi:DNA-binding MarR family transcriptional regulator [Acinetobacter calcoaceticus]|uniref:DNA-binding MarR family transcriptional regulator n=1 Tax=Acinetobacter calcoaceticus TaxID=471 RepID=A0A4R1XDX8_ACICA|nr:DNA-binding MarR family transcriptional regulator [Acinetobacter calcoaceticus]